MVEAHVDSGNSPLSIIVPVYQVDTYLARCLESILSQAFQEFELLTIDDGSYDSCGKLLDEYIQMNHRTIVVHQNNRGVSAARNRGLMLATGKFVGFVDPDDYIDRDMYRELVEVMKRTGADIACCNWYNILANGSVVSNHISNVAPKMCHEEFINHLFDIPHSILGSVCNKLFKRHMICAFFLEGCDMGEDTLFVLNYALGVNTAAYCDIGLYNCFHRPGSATRSGVEKRAHGTAVWRKAIELVGGERARTRRLAEKIYLDRCILFMHAKGLVAVKSHQYLKEYIRANFIHVMCNREVFWKTRILYILKALSPSCSFV